MDETIPFRSMSARDRYHTWYQERPARWPVPAEGRLIETAYGVTFVRVSGPPTAPPLVLLPALQMQDDIPAAIASLSRALALAKPEGYVRVFVDEGPAMAAARRSPASWSSPSM